MKNKTKSSARKSITAILFAVVMIASVLAVTAASVSAETSKEEMPEESDIYQGGNNLMDLDIGERYSTLWRYKWDGVNWGESCWREEYSIWYSGSIHESSGFAILDYFGTSYNDADKTAILKTGDIEVTRTISIPGGSDRYFTISYMLENTGSNTLSDVRFFEQVDYDVPWTGDHWDDNAWYDSTNDFVWIEDPGYFKNGFTGSVSSSNHGMDYYYTELYSDDHDGNLNGVNSQTNNDPAVGLQYNIGNLAPGATWEITMTFWFGEPYSVTPRYYLTMSTNYGTTIPVSGFYDEGTAVTITAIAPTPGHGEEYVWNGWTGTGPGSYTGMDNPASITMNGAISETASWILIVNNPPVANAGPDQTVEQDSLGEASVTLNGSGSFDPDGDPLTYTWTWASGSAPGVSPIVLLPLGTTTITLTVSDGLLTDTDTVVITVVDTTPPVISLLGADPQTIECDDAYIELGATATDVCCGDLTASIVIDASAVDTSTVGSYTVTYDVTDCNGNPAVPMTRTVNVVDTTPPDISVTVSPDTLWPPNHKMVDITATVTVSDICDAAPSVVLTNVTSDEPDDTKGKPWDSHDSTSGDGSTVNDIQGVETDTEDYEFQLRAERAGAGDGRVYTITYTVTDASGNSASASATVVVPHDMG